MFGGIKVAAAVALVVAVGLLAGLAPEPPATAAPATARRPPTPRSGPASKYDCALSIRPADAAFTGTDGTASEIGWEGNHQGVVTCLGGVFYIQDILLQELRHRLRQELRLRHLRRWPDHLDRCRRLPPGADHVVQSGRRQGLDHRVLRQGGARWRRLCRRL